MAKFHINKKGVPALCRAKDGNCPLGGGEKHFDNKEQAQQFIDIKNEKEHGLLASNIFTEEKKNTDGKKGKGVMLMKLYCPHCDEFHNEDDITIWVEMDYVTCKSTKKEIKTWKMDTENTVKWRNHMKFPQ